MPLRDTWLETRDSEINSLGLQYSMWRLEILVCSHCLYSQTDRQYFNWLYITFHRPGTFEILSKLFITHIYHIVREVQLSWRKILIYYQWTEWRLKQPRWLTTSNIPSKLLRLEHEFKKLKPLLQVVLIINTVIFKWKLENVQSQIYVSNFNYYKSIVTTLLIVDQEQ